MADEVPDLIEASEIYKAVVADDPQRIGTAFADLFSKMKRVTEEVTAGRQEIGDVGFNFIEALVGMEVTPEQRAEYERRMAAGRRVVDVQRAFMDQLVLTNMEETKRIIKARFELADDYEIVIPMIVKFEGVAPIKAIEPLNS